MIELFNPLQSDQLFDKTSLLFLNSYLEEKNKLEILNRVNLFLKESSLPKELSSDLLLIPTSGTTSFSLKLVALKKQALLNSADRVGNFFDFKPKQNWLLTLPLFHVGGLSILARAHCFQQKVFTLNKWDIKNFLDFFNTEDIQYVSLVPTQIHDLVKLQIKAPHSLKKVFVGGGNLAENLFTQAQNLGWPLVKTFGMTETASMIAYSQTSENNYQPLPDCYLSIHPEGNLLIKCDSLFSGYVIENKIAGADSKFIFEQPHMTDDLWQSEDLASFKDNKLTLLGRSKDIIKIKGELVNLNQLRDLLIDNFSLEATIISVPHNRDENELVCIVVKNPAAAIALDKVIKDKLTGFNKNVLPFEKIKYYLIVDTLPRTDLGKIKYADFSTSHFRELLNENKQSIME